MTDKPKILIIDDEEDIRDLYKSFLEGQNYYIAEASNGRDAFQLASKEHFDLFITDILMPEMNGVEFMKVLKMIEPESVVIIITGYDDMHYTREALEYGAFRYLTKPVNMKDFRNVVEMGLLEKNKLFHATTTQKISGLKDKLNSNPELQEKVFNHLHSFLEIFQTHNISSLEIGGPGSKNRIWVRRNKKLEPLPMEHEIAQDELNLMILSILNNKNIEILSEDKFLKFNYSFKTESGHDRFTFYLFFEQGNIVLQIKPVRKAIHKQADLNNNFLRSAVYSGNNSGLVLVTGPTGSGKSSLIDYLIDLNNSKLSGTIFIISNAIEYYHESKKSIVRHFEVSKDIKNLEFTLSKIEDLNPSMVVIDEIKSAETLRLVNNLIDSDILVLSTLKTKSAESSIQKLMTLASYLENEEELRRTASNLNSIACLDIFPDLEKKLVQTKEILINNQQIINIMVKGNISEFYNVFTEFSKDGNISKESILKRLVDNKRIPMKYAYSLANKPKQLKNRDSIL